MTFLTAACCALGTAFGPGCARPADDVVSRLEAALGTGDDAAAAACFTRASRPLVALMLASGRETGGRLRPGAMTKRTVVGHATALSGRTMLSVTDADGASEWVVVEEDGAPRIDLPETTNRTSFSRFGPGSARLLTEPTP